jgi:hypothetical protein
MHPKIARHYNEMINPAFFELFSFPEISNRLKHVEEFPKLYLFWQVRHLFRVLHKQTLTSKLISSYLPNQQASAPMLLE